MGRPQKTTLNEFVKQKIREKGLTNYQATELMGLNATAITGLKKRQPSVRTLNKLSEFLDVPVNILATKPITIRKESK